MSVTRVILLSFAIVLLLLASYLILFNNSEIPLQPDKITSEIKNNTKKYYTFGIVPQFEQRKLFLIWRPILNELEARTNIKIKMVGTARIPDFARKFLQGEFDFAYMNPYHMMQASETQGYIPLVRDGGRTLKGIVVVHKDSQIKSIKNLPKLNFVFPSPNALGASLLIKAELFKRNINYNPIYVQTHSSVYLHVAKKLYPIGGGVLSTLDAQKNMIKNSLRVIYVTHSVAPHPISAHPRVPIEIRMKVKHALLEMSKSEHFMKYLKKIPIHKMIPAKISEYISLRKLHLEKHYIAEIID